MVHGDKTLTVSVPESQDRVIHRVLALVLLVMASLAVWALLSLGT